MDVVAILGALAEQGVTSLLKADGERMRAHPRPWTFVASGEPLGGGLRSDRCGLGGGLPRVCGSPSAFPRADGARVR
jgi:hypothetical protein